MNLTFLLVGRMKSGPYKKLYTLYRDRLLPLGTGCGIRLCQDVEIPESRARKAPCRRQEEAEALLRHVSGTSHLIALDEKGVSLKTQDFAGRFQKIRDEGGRQLIFTIGGPDGHGAPLLARADLVLSFGALTWPHQLVRVMLAEQIYRLLTILSGHRYHREG